MALQGLEWFIYNRTAGYDNIVAQMQDDLPPTPAPTPAGARTSFDARDAVRKMFSRTSTHPEVPMSLVSSLYQKSPGFLKRALVWLKLQLPNFDPKNLLPMGIEATKGAIICGNASTPSLLVAEFSKVEGTYGIVQSRSKYDLYKQLVNLKFRNASLCYVENNDYHDRMSDIGQKVHDHIKDARQPPIRQSTYLSFTSFEKLWTRLKLWSVASARPSRLRALFGYPSVPVPHPPASWGWRKAPKSMDDETPVGVDFSSHDYAIERKILEAPLLELLYYADAVGVVPCDLPRPTNEGTEDMDPFDIGNGDLPPEWGMDFVVRGGFLRYGPWADRQRVILQQCFFPQVFHDMVPTTRLKSGDDRMWTALKVFIELQDGVTLHIPFREASKDWQWDGKVNVLNRPRKREAASIHVKAGDNSTISYVLPMVVQPTGYQPSLEVHLDTVTVTSSLNDIRLVTAESCRLRGQLPAPLKWNGERQWTFTVSLRQAALFLLRDHITMLTDVGKDWSSGPPTDYHRHVPMLYAVDLDMQYYEINMYVNDHNIIDKPLIKEDNALVTLRGMYLKHGVRIPLLQYRPEASAVSFWIDAPDVAVNLTLPRWNTHSLYPKPDRNNIGRIGFLGLNGSYRYHSDVHEHNIDLLKMDFTARDVIYKAFGWTVRHFMVLRDNYFGSFTHFCTLFEYLEKRRKGQQVGDPIELQYRPGKSNPMEVEVGVDVTRGMLVLPAGLPGYEVYSAEGTTSNQAEDLGSSLLLTIPGLQLQLRTNDYYMEMTLNIDNIFGRFEEHCYDDVLKSRRISPHTDSVIILDGLDITANRLFGPQPRNSTYVCIWEIHFGGLKASLSPYQTKLLSAVSTAFGFNFSDPLNAPAKDFAVPSDPDVTFLKLTLDRVELVWLAGNSAVEISLPKGLRIDSNDLAGDFHRKVTSIRLPSALLRLLLTSEQCPGSWYEASRVTMDADVDIYSAPPGWQESAHAQTEFICSQDKHTGRAQALYSTKVPHDQGLCLGRGLLDSDVYTPQLKVPSRTTPPPAKHNPSSRTKIAQLHAQMFSSAVTLQSESEGDEGISEADRDARLANSRPNGMPKDTLNNQDIDNDSVISSDESDDDDLTDPHDWESEASEFGPEDGTTSNSAWSLISQHRNLTEHLKPVFLTRPFMWNESPFVMVRRNPNAFQEQEDQSQKRINKEGEKHEQSIADDIKSLFPMDYDLTVIRLVSEHGVVVQCTPLVLPVVTELLEALSYTRLTPELRVDALLAELPPSSTSAQSQLQQRVTIVDGALSSVFVSSTQTVSIGRGVASRLGNAPTDDLPPSRTSPTTMHFRLDTLRLRVNYSESHQDADSCSGTLMVERMLLESKPARASLASGLNGSESTSCRLRIDGVVASYVHREVKLSVGSFKIDLCHTSLDPLFSTSLVIRDCVEEVMNVWNVSDLETSTLDQKVIFNVLKYSQQRTIIDPLSTIQPSYLVQKGEPDQIRRNSCFKFLIYLRACLRYLEASERRAVLELTPAPASDTTLQDIIPLLEHQYLSQGLDDDISNLPQQPLLRKLFRDHFVPPEPSVQQGPSVDAARIELQELQLVIHHPSDGARSEISLGSVALLGHMHPTTLQPNSLPTMGKSHHSLSLRDRSLPALRRVALSVHLSNVGVVIVPQLMDFLHIALRVTRSHVSSLSGTKVKNSRPLVPPMSQSETRHGIYLDTVISIGSLHFTAAADKLVVAFGLTNCVSITTLLAKESMEPRGSIYSINQSLLLEEVAIRLSSTVASNKSASPRLLASLVASKNKVNCVSLQEPGSPSTIRGTLYTAGIRFDVPRSALRLYRFLEDWRKDYLPGLEAALQTLLSEIHPARSIASGSAASTNASSLPIVELNVSLLSLSINLQVMLGTWLSWDIRQILLYLSSDRDPRRLGAHAFGLQVGPHTVQISTLSQEDDSAIPSNANIVLRLPVLTFKGHYQGESLQCIAMVEFLDILVKPSDWDILLSVRQKSGQDYNDLLHLIQETRSGKTMPSGPEAISGGMPLKISGTVRMKGFRIGVGGRNSTVYLECDDISGSIENNVDLAWQIQLSDLGLSLASASPTHVAHDVGHRSAFVIIDFQADMKRHAAASRGHLLRVSVTQVHAVMKPTSVGELGDFVDHLRAVVLVRQGAREDELAQFKEKTRSIMRSFDVKIGESQDVETSWMDEYSITVSILNIGVAFPLAGHSDLQMSRSSTQNETIAVRAFLFSIKSLVFGTEHGESGQAAMKGFSFQFVQRFRQSVPSDFSGDNHRTKNRLLYPEMTANVRVERISGFRRVCVSADVSGFILDLDSSIPDYVFALMDVYRQGKERIDRFAINISRPSTHTDPGTQSPRTVTEMPHNALPTSNIVLSSTFASGRVRMYSIRRRENSSRHRSNPSHYEFPSTTYVDSEVEIFDLPVVTVWGEYRASPSPRRLSGPARPLEPSILMFKSTIHSSENILRPTLLPFITDLVARVEERMRQTSRPSSQVSPMQAHDRLPVLPTEQLLEQTADPVSGLKISLSLRIDQSKLELTCQPDVNVIAGLHWDSGGFMLNIAPGARRVTFTGAVGGLTVGLRHGFLSDDCVRLDARNLALNITFSKMESDLEKSISSISVVVDTEFSGGVRFSRLQDVLCFKAVWLDRIPIFSGQHAEAATPSSRSADKIATRSSSQELATAILLRFRAIKLNADLGQSISIVTVDMRDVLLRSRLDDFVSELAFSISQLAVLATGNISGHLTLPDFLFRTTRNHNDHGHYVSGSKMLDVTFTVGVFSLELDSEYQKLLQYRAEPVEVKIFDDWSNITSGIASDERQVDVAFTVSGTEVVVIMNVGTIPKLVSYVDKFKLTLDNQREGASRESKAFRIASSPKPDNPLSAVANAMIKSTRSRLNSEGSIAYIIGQRMSLKLDCLQLVVFPRSMRDPEIARFIGRGVHARLDRLVGTDNSRSTRDLQLFFSSITTSRLSQLNHTGLAKEQVEGTKEWLTLLVKDAHEAIIFGLPSMDIRMRSEELENEGRRLLRYDFSSKFAVKQGAANSEDIYITLNMSLYSWLTALRKTFAREMEQVQATGDVRGAIGSLVQQTAAAKKRSNDPVANRPERESEDNVRTRSGPAHASRESVVDVMGGERVASPTSPIFPLKSPINPTSPSRLSLPPPLSVAVDSQTAAPTSKPVALTYEPHERHIERLTMRQLGEATPDVMHPFFMKKAGFSLEDSLPQYVHEYATMPTEEIMKALLEIYSKQLGAKHRTTEGSI